MNIICPTLNREESASEKNIKELIPLLKEKEDPFLILEKDQLTYMQILWSTDGYIIEYQEGSVQQHYQSTEAVSSESVIEVLLLYLKENNNWKNSFKFQTVEIQDKIHKTGYKLGYLFGKFTNWLKGSE
ncbi:MAG: hypothetical protein KAH64_03855 [Nitrosomonadaceae bacterium]|nr:hypothetical protein [Nitrosomonadaceae bacterium]